MDTSPLTDEELAARAAAGDPRAFARLHERHLPGLYDFVTRVVRDRRLAARALKAAAAEAHHGLREGQARGTPRAWLYSGAYRAALDVLLAGTEPRSGDPAIQFAPPGGEEEEVWAAAALLPPPDYALLDLHLRRGFGADELAPSLRVPRSALADRLARLQRELDAPAAEMFTHLPAVEPPVRHRPRKPPRGRRPLAAIAAVVLLAAVTTGAVIAARGQGVDDPAGLRSPSHRLGRAGPSVVAVAWSPQPGARGYSVLWSRDADRRPDESVELAGSATGAHSPALEAGSWWFSLRTRGDDGWSEGARLGPFVVPPTPTATIAARPDPASRTRSATFRFSASESGATFECALDGGEFRACESPRTYPRLHPGRHRLSVRATGVSEAPGEAVVYRWEIDVRTPKTRITRQPPGATRSTSALIRFAANEPGTRFRCKLDESPWYSCRSPQWFRHLTEQPHRLLVRARDRAGNLDRTPAAVEWRVDRTPPNTRIGGSARTGKTARFSLVADEADVGFRCSLDGAAFADCSSPLVLSGLSGGRHTLQVRAQDEAGNADATPAERTWIVDADAPGTLLTEHPPSVTRSRKATFSFTATEERVTFACSLDGRRFSPCSSPIIYIGLEPGTHVFRVRARDRSGNVDPTPVSWRWRVR